MSSSFLVWTARSAAIAAYSGSHVILPSGITLPFFIPAGTSGCACCPLERLCATGPAFGSGFAAAGSSEFLPESVSPKLPSHRRSGLSKDALSSAEVALARAVARMRTRRYDARRLSRPDTNPPSSPRFRPGSPTASLGVTPDTSEHAYGCVSTRSRARPVATRRFSPPRPAATNTVLGKTGVVARTLTAPNIPVRVSSSCNWSTAVTCLSFSTFS